jgi:pimeloyl-ACP methyl ester carboxylesterase
MTRSATGTFVDVPAGPIHVCEDGPTDAPAVVLVHGFASSLHWFDRLTPLLSADHRVVRMDLLGCGLSPRDGDSFAPETQTEMVLTVLDALEVEEFVPVGHSFGSEVAIGLAGSGRADKVVIIGQAPDYTTATLPFGHHLGGYLAVARTLQVLSRLSPARRGGHGFARGFRPDRAFADPRQPGLDLRATNPRTFRAVTIDRERSLGERPLDVRLKELGLPGLVILGGRDQYYPVAPTRARYDAVPNLRVEVIDHSGHSPAVEAPEATAGLLRDFLS